MKFTVSSNTLYQHLQTVAKVINPKSTNLVPILAYILFELRGNKLTLIAADSNTRLSSTLEINNEGGDGAFIALDRIVLDTLKDLPDQPITIEVNDSDFKSHLRYANGHYDFIAGSADSYPADIELTQGARTVTLPSSSLLEGINAAKVAASSTDTRHPIMTGVLLDFINDNLVYVATDGRILVRNTDTRVGKGIEPAQFCLPPAICKLLTGSLLPKESGEVTLLFDKTHLQVQLSTFTLTTLLLEGKYPAYNSVIPQGYPYRITIDREMLLFATRRVSLFANKASKLLLLEITPDKITIKANDLDYSTAAEETIPCEGLTIEELRIGFDYELLKALLEAIDSPQVVLELKDETHSGVITPITQKEGVEFLSLIIPMKLIKKNP